MGRARLNIVIIAATILTIAFVLIGLQNYQILHNAIIKPTSTVIILADCWRSIHIVVWEDVNGNGKQDNDEKGIKGVGYKVNGLFAELMTDPKLQSDEEGKINISLWSPGNCGESKFTVEVTNIVDRRNSTNNPIIFTLAPNEFSHAIYFGFQ